MTSKKDIKNKAVSKIYVYILNQGLDTLDFLYKNNFTKIMHVAFIYYARTYTIHT